jgi:hypothetical protein
MGLVFYQKSDLLGEVNMEMWKETVACFRVSYCFGICLEEVAEYGIGIQGVGYVHYCISCDSMNMIVL